MFTRTTRFTLTLALGTALLTGCNLFSPQLPSSNDGPDSGQSSQDPSDANPVPVGSLGVDGIWQQNAAGDVPACCVWIQNDLVKILDMDCNGTSLNIISSRMSTYGANGIAVGVVIADSSQSTEYTLYGFTLYPQADGTLAGIARIQPHPMGDTEIANVTWTPQSP